MRGRKLLWSFNETDNIIIKKESPNEGTETNMRAAALISRLRYKKRIPE